LFQQFLIAATFRDDLIEGALDAVVPDGLDIELRRFFDAQQLEAGFHIDRDRRSRLTAKRRLPRWRFPQKFSELFGNRRHLSLVSPGQAPDKGLNVLRAASQGKPGYVD
jgi:hypothetical protein